MLLILTTIRRLAILLLVFLAWTPAAYAWSWPVQGPVLQQFAYDEQHPYAAGQHRGIDIGADATGESVAAPASGTVSFAGTVPTNGKSLTIQTADGYSVTLTHLGSTLVAKGATVAEGDSVGTVGPSGTPEVDGPYVHLGIRHTADPNGYVDPLTFLPPLQTVPPDDGSTTTTVSQPSSSTAPAVTQPQAPPAVSPSAPVATARGGGAHQGRSRNSRPQDRRTHEPRTNARPQRPAQRASRPVRSGQHEEHGARVPHRRPSEPTRSTQRPVVETVAHEPTVLDAGHEIRPGHAIRPSAEPSATRAPDVLVPLICNGAAALVALAAALAAARRRRRVAQDSGEEARVLPLPQRTAMRRAA